MSLAHLFAPPAPVRIVGPTRTHQLNEQPPGRTPDQVLADSKIRMAIVREQKRQARIAAGTYRTKQEQARVAQLASADARRLPPEVALERRRERNRLGNQRRRNNERNAA